MANVSKPDSKGRVRVENDYGLTYAEWYAAAIFGVAEGRKPGFTSFKLRNAWRDGEDPTEWAASLA